MPERDGWPFPFYGSERDNIRVFAARGARVRMSE